MTQLQLVPAVNQYLMCFFVRLVYLVMEFVDPSVVMIKGKATGRYIAMSANGELHTTVSKNCLLLHIQIKVIYASGLALIERLESTLNLSLSCI